MALCSLTTQIVSQTRKSFKNKATVDAHRVCIIRDHIVLNHLRTKGILVYIHVWASALLDLERRAMRDA